MNCTHCGKELAGEAKFCDGCGSPIISEQEKGQQPAQAAPANQGLVLLITSVVGGIAATILSSVLLAVFRGDYRQSHRKYPGSGALPFWLW